MFLLPRTARVARTAHLRAIFGFAAVLSILSLTSGCDKREEPKQTTLAGKPRTLFFLFGDKADPRVVPIATLTGGRIVPIELDANGWRNFDKVYFPANSPLSLYQGGQPIGDATVKRGMWDGDPLYKLPKCSALKPLAAVTLAANASPAPAVMLELLVTSDPLVAPPVRAATTAADIDSARALLIRAAQKVGLTNSARSELDEVVLAFNTGATSHPTLVGSYTERGSALVRPRHVLTVGDYVDASSTYATSFLHTPGDSTPEFRRLIDHVDLTGDGVDELVLEGWHTGDDSFLVFLQFNAGHWREIARGATSWCADVKKKP